MGQLSIEPEINLACRESPHSFHRIPRTCTSSGTIDNYLFIIYGGTYFTEREGSILCHGRLSNLL